MSVQTNQSTSKEELSEKLYEAGPDYRFRNFAEKSCCWRVWIASLDIRAAQFCTSMMRCMVLMISITY